MSLWDNPTDQAMRERAQAMLGLWALASATSRHGSISIRGELPKRGGEYGMAIDSAYGSATGTDLTVEFVGSPGPGDQPCGWDYAAEAVESELAIVVIVQAYSPYLESGGTPPNVCDMMGFPRTAVASLAAPLGQRALLSIGNGHQISVLDEPPPSIQLR